MDAEHWQRLSPMLDALLELPPAAQAASLQLLRADDPALADELAELLALEAGRSDFLAEPLVVQLPTARQDARIGPYRLERQLGEGGMGQVWLARRDDGLYEKRVALKLLRPGLADPNLRLRFTRERQILARLEHAHIARLLDAGISQDQQPYLALEYVDGEPITDWCLARQPSVERRLRLFLQVCEAVSHAHANLIVHRDLKPSNILVTPLDEVRLLDFGIAKLLDTAEPAGDHTRTGMRTFTLHYAAPEQILGDPVTTMTDVYSLGVVLYELLADTKPYVPKRQHDAAWETAILEADPLRPSQALQRQAEGAGEAAGALRRRARQVAGDLDNIVLRALAKRPEQRYPSVEALALDLRRFLEGKPVFARRQSLAYRVRKYLRRHRWALTTTSLVAVVVFVAVGLVLWQARQAVQESARAQALQSFVVGLFRNAGNTPSNVPLDVRQLLSAGVERGDQELARQPVSHAELLGLIARLRSGLGDYQDALDLLSRQQRILGTIDAPPASLRLDAATDLGRVHRLLGQHRECVVAMQPWQALARREESRLPAQSAEFDSQLGRCRRALRDMTGARVLFQRALQLRRDVPAERVGRVENLADLAALAGDAGDTTRALRDMRAALSQLRRQGDARHPLAIDLLRTLCSMEREGGNLAGAHRDCAEALALSHAVLGPDDRRAIDARRQLAAIHVDQGRFAEAEAEFTDTMAWLVDRLGQDHPDVSRNHNSLAIVAWERGDVARARQEMARAVAGWRHGDDPLLLAGGLFNQAMLFLDEGRADLARPLVAESLALRRANVAADRGVIGDTLRLQGEIEAALGHDTAARRLLEAAVEATLRGFGDTHPHARRAQIALARHQALHGDTAALARLDALARPGTPDLESRKTAWRAVAYAAAARCRGGTRDQAMATLQALRATLRERQPEGGTLVRQVDAIARDCARGT